MKTIVLRTVCGCERILEIPFNHYPQTFTVPYVRRQNLHVYAADGETCMATLDDRRTFENTGQPGRYGYPAYLEVLK